MNWNSTPDVLCCTLRTSAFSSSFSASRTETNISWSVRLPLAFPSSFSPGRAWADDSWYPLCSACQTQQERFSQTMSTATCSAVCLFTFGLLRSSRGFIKILHKVSILQHLFVLFYLYIYPFILCFFNIYWFTHWIIYQLIYLFIFDLLTWAMVIRYYYYYYYYLFGWALLLSTRVVFIKYV